jgi:hypothetical protein
LVSKADVTGLYRRRLSIGNAQLLARVDALWRQVFDPRDPSGSLAKIGPIVGRWVTGAQAGAAAEATRYLQALYAAETGIPLDMVRSFRVPADLVGTVQNGMTTMQYLDQAPGVYFNRLSKGYSDQMAADSTLAWLNMTAGSEPWRVANGTVTDNADLDERYSGRVRRMTRAGACDFCTLIADRGYIPANAGFEAHTHCHCTPEPEISSHVRSRSAIRRGMAASI